MKSRWMTDEDSLRQPISSAHLW